MAIDAPTGSGVLQSGAGTGKGLAAPMGAGRVALQDDGPKPWRVAVRVSIRARRRIPVHRGADHSRRSGECDPRPDIQDLSDQPEFAPKLIGIGAGKIIHTVDTDLSQHPDQPRTSTRQGIKPR